MQQEDFTEPAPSGKAKTNKPSRLSDIVRTMDTEADTTIGTLVDSLGERAFGALMFIFAVPNIIPTPPGTSAILGLPLVILTWQVMIGRQSIWLPEVIRKRQISRDVLRSFVSKVLPYMGKIEKVLKPRFGVLVSSDASERVIGFVTFALSLVLFLPIPLNNMLPAAAISCIALGLAERDGIAVGVGYLLGIASVAVLAAISSALYIGVTAFFRALLGM